MVFYSGKETTTVCGMYTDVKTLRKSLRVDSIISVNPFYILFYDINYHGFKLISYSSYFKSLLDHILVNFSFVDF